MWTYEIISAIPLEEIESYFSRVSLKEGPHRYEHDGWIVVLYPLEHKKHGMIVLPQTRIEFTGDEAICKEVIAAYRKAFMRGGA